jgi:Zn-dependent protease
MSDTDVRGGELRHVRPSPVFLALVAVCVAAGWYAWHDGPRIAVFLLVMAGWLISVCLHEFAHAFYAWRSGDTSVVGKGYLTLDPLKYSDPLLTIILPTIFVLLGGIPLTGGAVYIERQRIQGRLKHSLVSAVGPLTNVVLAVALALLISNGAFDGAGIPFQAGIAFLAQLQVMAALLNLLPVPGLDGFGIIEPWLSHEARKTIAPFAPYGILLLFALLWEPRVNSFFYGIVDDVTMFLDIPKPFADLGYSLFKFWS